MAKFYKKRKLFYPKGEQKLGLLTKGKEWMDAETYKEYKGPYHRFSDGVVMTGGSPSKRSRYLMPYKDQTDASAVATQLYRNITTVKVDKFIAPKFHYPRVRQKDLSNGYITRYFVQKKNNKTSATIMEINGDQYGKVANKNKQAINGKMYDKFELRWKIVGDEEEIKKTNTLTLNRIEEHNRGIKQYLGDLTEFSKFSPIISD